MRDECKRLSLDLKKKSSLAENPNLKQQTSQPHLLSFLFLKKELSLIPTNHSMSKHTFYFTSFSDVNAFY